MSPTAWVPKLATPDYLTPTTPSKPPPPPPQIPFSLSRPLLRVIHSIETQQGTTTESHSSQHVAFTYPKSMADSTDVPGRDDGSLEALGEGRLRVRMTRQMEIYKSSVYF